MATRKAVRTAFEKCLLAVEPRSIVRNAISLNPSLLKIADYNYSLSNSTKIVVIAFGKASILMAKGARDQLKSSLLQKTIVIAPEQQKGIENELENDTEILYGARDNLPDEKSVFATRKVISEIRDFDSESTIFLFLISGGGSALLTSPSAPLDLAEKLETIRIMQAHGATIQELNTIRQNLSDVKGGKLLREIKKGCSIALIISDVIGNPVELIASGPTVIPAHQQDKFIISNILESLKINKLELPVNVKNVLENHEKEQLPENTSRFQNFIISSNNFALRAAAEYLTSSGYNSTIVTSSLSGNAAEIGKKFAEIITEKSITSSHLLKNSNLTIENYPIALLFGGETTVHLSENPGKGGRNQEMVLSCLDALKTRVPAHNFTFLSAGTDGQDGPTDAAGAIISNEDLPLNSLLNSSEFLQNSDSYNFWRQFKGGANHILTGPSGTNVMDIQILLLDQL